MNLWALNMTPHAVASHWSARYIGRPWSERFTCWHLVQEVQWREFGLRMPDVNVSGTAPDQHEVLAALMRTGDPWQPVPVPLHGSVQTVAAEGDVLLMAGNHGPHVGVVLRKPGAGVEVLHNMGGRMPGTGRVHGGVRVDAVAELGLLNYGRLRLWRARPARPPAGAAAP